MNIKYLTFLFLCLPLLAFADNREQDGPTLESLLSMDLEMLGQVQIYTASRELTSIEKAPSVVSVITAEQIERQGLKSLYEVLARVPGFFNATSPFMEPVSNRGFAQNVNTNYLLLVDGHSLNSDAINGFGHLHMMPGLNNIARIEIIRGPGSTLWGANAAMGVVHLITKGAVELDKNEDSLGSLQLSVDHEFDHQRNVVQGTYGKKFDQGSIMAYGKYFNSNADWTTSYQAGANDFEIQSDRQMNVWDFHDSHVLYTKFDWQGWLLKAGKVNFENQSPLFAPIDGTRETSWTSKKNWIEIGSEHYLNTNISLEWKLFQDDFSEERVIIRPQKPPRLVSKQIQTSMTEGLGGEAIMHFRNQAHHLLLGVSASNVDLSLNTFQIFPSGFTQEFITVPAINDKNRALFIEENYRGLEDWILTFGLRVDQNEPRGNITNYLPRVAVTYSISDHWNIKYAINTGYVAPTLTQTRGGIHRPFGPASGVIVKGAEDIQESSTHDLQLFYKDGHTQANLTLFYHTLTDIIQFSGFGPVTVAGIPNVTLFEVNASDMDTFGLEFEGETKLDDGLRLYGNYAFADAKYQDQFATFQGQVILDIVSGASIATEDLTVTGTPQNTWNLGLDWNINERLSLNTHYRGWANAFSKNSDQPSFKRFGAYHYLDLNLRYQDFLTDGLIISAYIKNLFDNDRALPGGVNEGKVEPQNGQQIGFELQYRF